MGKASHAAARRMAFGWALALGAALLPLPGAAQDSPGRPQLDPAHLGALQRASDAVVGVQARAVEGARSARTLGRERAGSGIVIGTDGLVLTIGYLILEADASWLLPDDGRRIPARVVAYDLATGFGLLKSLVPLNIEPAPLGRSAGIGGEEPLLVASGGEGGSVSLARLLSRRPFAGYWEYLIEGALFTAPARPDHSGAGLFNAKGELIGVGSLFLSNAAAPGAAGTPGNMFVPIDLLTPIIDELRQRGSSAASTRAWLGINCAEQDGGVRVLRVNEDSPADVAGLQAGDRILSIDGHAVSALAELWKTLWMAGKAERPVSLHIQRKGESQTVIVHAVDRAKTLRRPEGI
jgi:S1-C subfamily serine protease